jgi:hypothetical protein
MKPIEEGYIDLDSLDEEIIASLLSTQVVLVFILALMKWISMF